MEEAKSHEKMENWIAIDGKDCLKKRERDFERWSSNNGLEVIVGDKDAIDLMLIRFRVTFI